MAAARIETRDRLFVRAIRPTDRAALGRAFEHLSAESRYRRFLAPIKRLTDEELDYLTDLDHLEHEALVALTGEGEIVGVARYVRLGRSSRVAEVAVTVVDEWQRRGIATELLHRLARRAAAAGIATFVGICLASNTDMIEVLRDLDPSATVHALDPGLVEVDVDLPTAADREQIAGMLKTAARPLHTDHGPAQSRAAFSDLRIAHGGPRVGDADDTHSPA